MRCIFTTRIAKRTCLTGMIVFCASSFVAATELQELDRLADTGAVDLAINLLEAAQPALISKPKEWMLWERKRVSLYQRNKDWQKIATRLQRLPAYVDSEFIIWAKMQRARALIRLRDGQQARMELRTLLWQSDVNKISEEELTLWRQLIIDSYLSEGFAADAQMANIRLQQDVRDDGMDSTLQRARIAMLNKQYKEVLDLLKPHADNPEVAGLMLLAQLRGHQREAKDILKAAHKYLRDAKIKHEQKINFWAVAAEAGQVAGRRAATANATEHVLAEKQHLNFAKSIYDINSTMLWNAYIDYAEMLGNDAQLLIGEDDKWMATAKEIAEKKPVGARSMYVFVILRGQSNAAKQKAAEKFSELLLKRKHGNQLLVQLFAEAPDFKQVDSIPVAIRHHLVDIALSQSDIDRASEIMATIDAPPAGTDQFMWQLRRARILVLGNQTEVGAKALLQILATHNDLPQQQLDKMMQVVFDLQSAGKHDLAVQCFEQIWQQTKVEQVQREIYYWMADSRKSQERFTEAAQLYLKSAMYPDPKNMDPWAQTAHYQAAESLSRAGLYNDARTLFERLLRVTEDPTRRATLQRELHRLWAMQ